ncbi:hypothetical protein AMELA_G00273790 [Ameiurus melas]|uniref:Uncharacterized protein n=1 Tax=Ameiurus melas TaxID=219545 RepID=A0A7J5ZNW2_AMEME|nr:hypothetical protein AMELA_G00273790 [Ameiurus melas]
MRIACPRSISTLIGGSACPQSVSAHTAVRDYIPCFGNFIYGTRALDVLPGSITLSPTTMSNLLGVSRASVFTTRTEDPSDVFTINHAKVYVRATKTEMEVTRRRDSSGQFSDNSDHDCEESSTKCNECGKNRAIMARYSEGYGTEEECVQSDPQRESDADADVEDADTRLQVVGSLQRISSRKRRRQRVTRQDTTESEDDGGQSHRNHRWSLRLSPHRSPNRTILEESVSQFHQLQHISVLVTVSCFSS